MVGRTVTDETERVKMALTFNYQPHPAQLAIHQARSKRFRSVCTGRRFGKTLCLAAELLDRGGCEKAGDYGWVAPTYNVAERGIEAFRTIAEGFIQVCGRAPSKVEFTGPAGPVRVWFLSADNPDNIRGFGFQGLVVDEAASIPVNVWHYVLRPTIAQTLGWAVFVSTPKGRNWFYDLFTRGMDPGETDYASFRFPSNASPYFPAKEWEEAKRTLPADVFRQEYEAEFLEDSAGVFRNIEGCLINDPSPVNSDQCRYVVIGCDVAKHTDWTVLIAMDAETGRCFAMDRFNHLDWPIQKERILGFARKYRGRLILDASGVGDPIFDDLKRVYPDIEAFKFTHNSKTELVQRVIVAVEQSRVSWPAGPGVAGLVGVVGECVADRAAQITRDTGLAAALSRDAAYTSTAAPTPPCGQASLTHSRSAQTPIRDTASPIAQTRWTGGNAWDILTAEMRRYEYAIGPSGSITYSAPSGYHDDCVMALALANHRRWETESCGRMLRVAGSGRRQGLWGRRERVLVG